VHRTPVVRDLPAWMCLSQRSHHTKEECAHREADDGIHAVLLEIDVERLEERDVSADVVGVRRVREVLPVIRRGRVRRRRRL
jgi:hypothetical protein